MLAFGHQNMLYFNVNYQFGFSNYKRLLTPALGYAKTVDLAWLLEFIQIARLKKLASLRHMK